MHVAGMSMETGFTFALTAMIGAYGGGRIAQAFDGKTLLLLFVAMMATTAVAMFRGLVARDSAPV